MDESQDKPLWDEEPKPTQTPQPQPQPSQPLARQRIGLFHGLRENKKYVLKASVAALVFWLLQFSYQYFILIPNEFGGSLVRSFALSGATLISIALIIGPLSKLTRYNYIFHRRTFGVWGFTFIIMHAISVCFFLFGLDLTAIFWNINPFMNLILFGLVAFLLFLPVYLTSTDWAVDRLGFKKWKKVHRLVYFAYIFAVIHYTRINPSLLYNLAGYALLSVTVLALILQVGAFVKTIKRTHSKKAAILGFIIILFGLILLYVAFFKTQ